MFAEFLVPVAISAIPATVLAVGRVRQATVSWRAGMSRNIARKFFRAGVGSERLRS